MSLIGVNVQYSRWQCLIAYHTVERPIIHDHLAQQYLLLALRSDTLELAQYLFDLELERDVTLRTTLAMVGDDVGCNKVCDVCLMLILRELWRCKSQRHWLLLSLRKMCRHSLSRFTMSLIGVEVGCYRVCDKGDVVVNFRKLRRHWRFHRRTLRIRDHLFQRKTWSLRFQNVLYSDSDYPGIILCLYS